MPTATLELSHLIAEIVYHPVDLLDHRLCQDLNLNADLDSSYRPSGHKIARIGDGSLTWNNFAECSVTTACRDAPTFVLDIQHAIPSLDCRSD